MVTKEWEKEYQDIPGVASKARPFRIISQPNNDTLVIVVHGFTSSPYDMHYLSEYLSAQGFDIEAVLLAGHGSSFESLKQSNHYQWYQSVEDVYLKNKDNYKNIFVIGYSFGNNLNIHLARQHKNIKGIISLGIPILIHHEKEVRFCLPFARTFCRRYRKGWLDKEDTHNIEEQGHHIYIPIPNIVHFFDFVDHITKKEIDQIEQPILIMHSRDDLVSNPRSSEILWRQVKSKDKLLYILDKHNHNLLHSTRKDFVFSRVTNFRHKYTK